MSDDLILIVDDQPENLQMLSTTLREAGYQVAAANNGPTAFRVLARRLPDLVLCDIVMPEMDGYEVCRRLKAETETRDIPLMFLTARTDSQAMIVGFESGAVDYVTKPFNTGELLARVRTQLELRQARLTILDYAARLDALLNHQNQVLQQAAAQIKGPLEAMLLQAGDLEQRSGEMSAGELASGLRAIQSQIRQLLGTIEALYGSEALSVNEPRA